MKARNHPYYLIGASALALDFLKKGIKPPRSTKDIDFVVMLSNLDEYEKIVHDLELNGFHRVKEVPHRLRNQQMDVEIDLLPFGKIEDNRTIKFLDKKTELHVLGFSEVLNEAEWLELESLSIPIPSIDGLALLKLIAWGERPERRAHDLADILHIIENYFDYNYDEIVEFHYDTFPKKEEENFDQLKIGAIVLGRKAKKYLEKSELLNKHVSKLLENNLKERINSAIAKEWAQIKNMSIEKAYIILEAFKKGME